MFWNEDLNPRCTKYHRVHITWQPLNANEVLQFWHRPLWSENEHAITLCGSPLKETYLTPVIGSISSCQGSRARCVILNSFSSGWALDQGHVHDWSWLIFLHIRAMSNSGHTTGDRPQLGEGAAIKAWGWLLFRLVAELESAAQVAD